MHAAVLHGANEPLAIEEIEIIDARADEVLVHTSTSGVDETFEAMQKGEVARPVLVHDE